MKYLKIQDSKKGYRPAERRRLITRPGFHKLHSAYVAVDAFAFKVPFHAIKFAIPSLRPSATWTWKRSMLVVLIRNLMRFSANGRFPSRIDLSGDQIETFKATPTGTPVWIPKLDKPLTGELGEMMAQSGDQLARCSAWWYGKDHQSKPDGKGKIILHLHGGGYIQYSATPKSPTIKPLIDQLARNAKEGGDLPVRGMALEYRKSDNAALPGIISDAVACWRYLVEDCGYKAENIVVSGDSAGGNLALGLTRYLVEEKPLGDSIPKGLILLSPWVDLSISYIYAGAGKKFERYDYLSAKGLDHAASEVLRGCGSDSALSPYASHVSLARPFTGKEFAGWPKAILAGGELEKFNAENRALAEHYGDAGAIMEAHFDKDVPHDVYALPFAFEQTQLDAVERHTRWLQKLW